MGIEGEMPGEIRAKFAEGAKALSKKEVYKTQGEWEVEGLTKFKRRVLGFCRGETVKSLDELAGILTELRIVNFADAGKQLIQELYGIDVYYGNGHLVFSKVQNRDGQEACRIHTYEIHIS